MPRILIIDDEKEICEMIRQKFEPEGYEVGSAPNGKVGLKLQKETPFDLVITDIFMPEKEGIETIRELRRDFPDLKIIAITGGYRYGPDELLEAARMLGANKTLAKPFKLGEIKKAVEELLGVESA